MNPWPHQTRGMQAVLDAISRGTRRILLTSPTGGGKSLMMRLLAQHYLDQGDKVVLYTNRKALVDQTSDVLMAAGVYHGVRAAGYEDEREHPLQISSIQTENARVLKRGTWKLHEAGLVMVDEAHLQRADVARKLLDAHSAAGAAYVGFSATPIGLADLYDELIVAGDNSELRECGALVPAHHHGADEPDMRLLRRAKIVEGEDLSGNQASTAMGFRKMATRQRLLGRIWEWFCQLNPDRRPTICFGPDVPGSIWLAEQFSARGCRAAHIDGEHIWLDGQLHRTSRELRRQVLDESRAGTLPVLCNRFVLREGIDAPWLAHGIFATIFGSLQTYLQSGGRLLRAHPSLDCVTIQDHGGNWWRHGALNADREWRLDWTGSMHYGIRAKRLRDQVDREPFRCPACGMIWQAGTRCQPAKGGCGHELDCNKRSRPIVTLDGKLASVDGRIFKSRPVDQLPDGPKVWEKMYYRSRQQKRTFLAAAALYAKENHWRWPDQAWPFMPTNDVDWFRRVDDVPREDLT